jgi:hypothetical protein
MGNFPLSEDLEHLRNMIARAKSDVSIRLLRDEIRSAADEAPAADVIRIAHAILQCGIDKERGQWATRN